MLDGGGGGGYGGFYLDASWPGLDSGDKIDVDRDELKKIIKILQADLDSYSKGDGTLNDLQSRGNVTVAELGNYPAGQGLGKTTTNAFTQITGSYTQFLSSYGAVISALRKAVGDYDEMELNNTATANSVTPGSGAQPTRTDTKEF